MYYRESSTILSQFNSSKTGLSGEQVLINRKAYGENKLEEKGQKSIGRIFIDQFKDFLVIILIIAAMISAATDNFESAAVIVAVLILNAILGTVQYVKASKSLASLKKLSSPTAKVIRDGKKISIPAEELVVGDIIYLEAGDIVPGDGRVLESYSLKVNESALTGESESVEKFDHPLEPKGDNSNEKIALGDQKNMVFSSSLVVYGRATVIITSVGINTQIGLIADLMNKAESKKTPLQITIDAFSKRLSIGIIILCGIIFALNLYRSMPVVDSLLFAVALAVAAIPEALSSIITISLAIGTSRMAEEHAIIKELSAVEGLGCVSIICSDKTGTLTQNKMTVENTYTLHPEDNKLLQLASILCNDTAHIEGALSGDPTETALVEYFINQGGDYEATRKRFPRLSELPFDSDRKLMSTLHQIDGKYIMFTKGALDVILSRACNLSDAEKETIDNINTQWSNQGLRVLALAQSNLENSPCQINEHLSYEDEAKLTFIGIIAEMDPPRPETKTAVENCRTAGIKPIMITGDHKITASAIAKRIGIMEDGDRAVTGPELDAMSDAELMESLRKISVYARVSPANKIRIVKAWQSTGNIVSMTGDGVNDAPALKSADVGVAMGITGTDVSKDAASMILTDDNFATILKAVLNGRNIYANIKNSIKFLLSGNTAGIFVVLYAALVALPNPFTAVHLLFINLITDSLPALALNFEPINPGLIRNKPRPRTESVITYKDVVEIVLQGILIGGATVAAFYIGLRTDTNYTSMTMAFATLCLARLWHGFNCRGRASVFKLGIFSNRFTIGALAVGGALLFTVLMVPSLSTAFTVASLTGMQILCILGLSILPTIIIQLCKVSIRSKN